MSNPYNDSTRERALLIEDDSELHDLLKIHTREMGLILDGALSGEHGLELALEQQYDVIIVDWNLPGVSGIEICRRLRSAGNTAPIMMLTARSDEVDKILGFEAGADDYMSKPFSVRELSARIMALLRRSRISYSKHSRDQSDDHSTLVYDELVIDLVKRLVFLSGKSVDLTAREFDLLVFLANHPGRPFTREQLLENVWHHNTLGYERVVTTYVGRVRSKLSSENSGTEYILTVRGIGYKFSDEMEPAPDA